MKIVSSLWLLVAASSACASASRVTTASPTAIVWSSLMVTNTGLSGRGCSGAVLRQVDADIDGRKRRRHHEDDEQHQNDVDEGRDVDLVLDLEIVAAGAGTKTHRHAATPPRAAAPPHESPGPG